MADSVAIFSKMSLMKLFMMDIALEEMPVSGCTCLSTCSPASARVASAQGARQRGRGPPQIFFESAGVAAWTACARAAGRAL